MLADPNVVIGRVESALANESLSVRWVRPREGYIETNWFNAESGRRVRERSLDVEMSIRFRFWIDPLRDGETQLISEAVQLWTVDPSLPIRESELLLAEDHPGQAALQRIIDTVITTNDTTASGAT